MAEDILGISGQMDITDIQKSFDALTSNLNQLGLKTDEISAKMTKALNEISSSAATDAQKTQQAIQIFKDGITELSKTLAETPDALKKLAAETQTAETALERLKSRIAETAQGSKEWSALNGQLTSQQQLVARLNEEYNAMLGTFGSTQQHIGILNAAIDTLNAGKSLSTATTAASTAAHIGAASAVGVESVAHGNNASSISEETKQMQANVEAAQQVANAGKQSVITFNAEAAAIDAATDRLRAFELSEEEYQSIIEGTKERIAALTNEYNELAQKAAQPLHFQSEFIQNPDGTTTRVDTSNAVVIQNASEKASGLKAQIDDLQSALDNLTATYNEVENAAVNEAQSASDAETKVTEATQKHTAELERKRQTTESVAQDTTIWWDGEVASIENVTRCIEEDEKELKRLKAAYANLKGAGEGTSDAAKRNLEEQKSLNRHITEGRDVLKQLGSSYEEAKKEAKDTAEETKKIGKSADDAQKKVGGIFSNIKKSIGGALKGDFSSFFGIIGKIGAWGAGIAAVGKGLYELCIRAEQFRAALQPLSHYVDKDTLGAVKQNILSLSSQTTKSVSDMAAAATQFAKVWSGMNASPEALTQMIESSNKFGALAGKTSEESAKYLSNLASEYHLTAQEATEASTIIATAAHNSTSTFAEMAEAISNAGSTAALYGVSFKEMASLIGYSSGQFGGAQKAASKFSMLLMSMSKLQDEYNPAVVGMVKALQNLKEAYERGEHVESNFMARTRAAAMYFIKNADNLAAYNKKITDNSAETELLNDANKKASTNVKKLQNAWESFLTSINTNLTPTLTEILKFFTRIIGGAQRTADELDYLKNYDEIHSDSKGKTSGALYNIGASASLAVSTQYRTQSEEANLKEFNRQRKILEARYRNRFKYTQEKFPKMSLEERLNDAQNSVVGLWNSQRDTFSEYNKKTFLAFLARQRRAMQALNQQTNNTNVDNGGDGNYDKNAAERQAEKQRQYREQQAEQEAKQLAEAKKLEWDMYIAEQEAGIAKEHDANEKELKQRKLDFAKKKHQIEEEAEQLRQKNIAEAKADYEKNPANEKKEGFYASGLDKGVKLTAEQKELIDAKTRKLDAEKYESEEKALKAVTDKYKTTAQERLDIERKYDKDIAKIQEARKEREKTLSETIDSDERERIQKQIGELGVSEGEVVKKKGEELMSFDFEQLKKDPDYIQAFEDLNSVSSETLTRLIALFEEFKRKAGEAMSPEALREYMDTMQKMQDELLGRDNPVKQVASAQMEYVGADEQVKSIETYLKTLDKSGRKTKETITLEKKLNVTYETREAAEKALAKAKDKRNQKETKYLKAVKNLNDKINELAASISNLGSMIGGTEGQILSLIGSVLTFVTQTSNGIKTVAATGAQAISTIEKASVILGIISAAIQLLQAMSSLFKDSHAQYEEYAEEIKQVNNLTNAVNEYRLAALAAAQARKSWFAPTELTDLRDAAEYHQQALKAYVETATQAQAIYENEKGGGWLTSALKWAAGAVGTLVSLPGKLVSKGLEAIGVDMGTWLNNLVTNGVDASFGGVEAIIGKAVASLANSDNYEEGTTAAINNLRIETRKKSSGFLGTGIGSHSQRTENLVEWARNNGFGELFDENGFINTELAQTLIDKYGEKLVGETKETLEELIKFKEEYDKFNEQLEEYVSDAFSPLTDNLTDALFDWLDTGEDVMDKFKEYASETFQDIAKSIVKTAIVQTLFGGYEDKIKELYKAYSLGAIDETSLWSSISDATKLWMGQVETQIPQLQEFLKAMDKSFEDLGIAIGDTDQSEQEATTKAIEAITADQASNLIGIGYAMQIALEQGNEMRTVVSKDVSSLRVYSQMVHENITEIRDIQYEGLGQLQQIAKNTAPIILIREDISSMYKLMKDRY